MTNVEIGFPVYSDHQHGVTVVGYTRSILGAVF